LVLANAEAGDYASADHAVKQLRFAADSLEEVQLINRLVQHVRDQKPWMLETRPDKSRLDHSGKLYQELTASQPNLQVPFLQAHYERTCDELLANKSLTAAERNICLRRRSLSRYWQGKIAPAIEDVEALLQEAPKDDSLFTLLCRCHLANGDLEAASKTRERLQQVNDGSAAHRFSSELMQAEIDLARIQRPDPQTDGQRDKLIAQTAEKIDQLIRRAPQQMALYRMRAAARFHAADYPKALEDNETCLKLTAFCSRNEMADVVLLHALILEKLHRFDHSLQYASMAMALEGDSSRSRELLARVYRTMGKERLAQVWDKHESADQPKLQPVADSQPVK
ncbi:MAG: tetratricopeptide repeat protein, partial [Planctomycetaceae bacterium]